MSKPVRRLFTAVLPVALLVGVAYTAGAQNSPGSAGNKPPGRQVASAQRAPEAQLPPPSNEQLAIAQAVSHSFAQIASQMSPSVVRIIVRSKGGGSSEAREDSGNDDDEGSGANPFEGTPFERFFDGRRRSPRHPRNTVGMGSGVVIDSRGYILTNNHVVEDATEVRVTFVDGVQAKAKVVGTDPKSDLAVIKVEGVKVVPARFGDSDRMRVGEMVMAVGNPFGLDHSVTIGVLSAKNRAGFTSGNYEDFLQTDASINPGNSGGPLVNLNGEVIGINTMIVGLGTGVGFAVASSMAQPIARQLIEHGRVQRPYIGIVMQSMTPELGQSLGEHAPTRGALVSEVQKDSPAARAGMKPGDVVIAVDGQSTEDSHAVQRAVLAKPIGANLDLTVWRSGRQEQVRLRTVELPGAQNASKQPGEPEGHARLGITLQTISPELARRLEVPAGTRGAVVTGVREGSPALEAGLRPGDVIVEIDHKAITTADEAGRAFSEQRTGGHLVRVRRAQGALFIVVPAQ